MVQMVMDAWPPEFYAWDLVFVRVFMAVTKHSDQKQPGEERFRFVSSLFIMEGCQGENTDRTGTEGRS